MKKNNGLGRNTGTSADVFTESTSSALPWTLHFQDTLFLLLKCLTLPLLERAMSGYWSMLIFTVRCIVLYCMNDSLVYCRMDNGDGFWHLHSEPGAGVPTNSAGLSSDLSKVIIHGINETFSSTRNRNGFHSETWARIPTDSAGLTSGLR